MVKNVFFCNYSKNIDIWILLKEQNLFRREFYMCVPSLVKIDWEMHVKNPRWPPRIFFPHFNIRPRWFPAHHRDRLVFLSFFWIIYFLWIGETKYDLIIEENELYWMEFYTEFYSFSNFQHCPCCDWSLGYLLVSSLYLQNYCAKGVVWIWCLKTAWF